MTRGGRASEARWARLGWLWWLVAAVLVTAALLGLVSRQGELRRAAELLTRIDPAKALVALFFEAAALVCLAAMQRWFLATGGLRMTTARMVPLVLSANAIAGVLPAGAAFAVAWLYRQLRRRGAGEALTAGVLVVSGGLSALALLTVIAVGTLTAGSRGPGPELMAVLAVLATVAVIGLIALRSAVVRRAMGRGWARVEARYGRTRSASKAVRGLVTHARRVRPGVRPWLWPVGLALLNWVFDAACLVASLWALGVPIPWAGLLLIYGLVQIPVSARLTPGGIGIAEASLTALLVLYGLQPGQAFAAALVYRIWSFWLPQLVGWACWLGITLRETR
ncbi:flippase-like domain-containing protein [Streptomyces durbertensis]|uniref:Flippase-like domain-containing protein n=1 Tax=Streptomyces durbertensis TaxID=2448886 RepID=A0ABR6EIN1_9ACTN|nr:lysylphosphatidylglycerol synthase transmembrane domain-containing protein [Streptomyces durbertensis]MBB1245165.1 flippase-like domain-containing protein [Streptomyces durbertensis]